MSDVAAAESAPPEAPSATKFEPSTVRKPPAIERENVKLDVEGFVTREIFVRLPEGFTADDLKEPGVWRRIQTDPRKALRQFDKLLLVAFDEAWAAEAIVTRAGHASVVLSRPRIIAFGSRYDDLFEDDKYRVKWYGNGYAVERKADNARMTHIVANSAIAERDLGRLYPKVG